MEEEGVRKSNFFIFQQAWGGRKGDETRFFRRGAEHANLGGKGSRKRAHHPLRHTELGEKKKTKKKGEGGLQRVWRKVGQNNFNTQRRRMKT